MNTLLNVENVIFDMDDTILVCGKYYIKCRKDFAEFNAKRTGLPERFCESILHHIDLECTTLANGWGKDRFPRSFAAASVTLDILSGKSVDETAAEQSFLLGESVFHAPYELIAGAIETLTWLSDHHIKLFLYTKGDYNVQQEKIIKHNLTRFFPTSHQYIVPHKSGHELNNIIVDHELNIDETILVGDSMRDDVMSAKAVNMRSVLVMSGHPWGYDQQHVSPTLQINSIADLPDRIEFVPFNDQLTRVGYA